MLSSRFARDTAVLSNRINLKLNIADTAAMFTNYLASIHTKENAVNKSTDTSLGGLSPSNVLFPTQLAVKRYIENNAATISSSSTGNVVDATTSIKGKIQLAGDLGGTAASPQVLSIGGILKDTLAEAINLMKAATPDNIVNYMVRRSPIGDFSGSTITANTFRGNLIGNVTGNITGNVTGNLNGNATTATTAGNITATSNTTLTSLANLNTVGTITSGVWSGTIIDVAHGGTGLATTSQNYIFAGPIAGSGAPILGVTIPDLRERLNRWQIGSTMTGVTRLITRDEIPSNPTEVLSLSFCKYHSIDSGHNS